MSIFVWLDVLRLLKPAFHYAAEFNNFNILTRRSV